MPLEIGLTGRPSLEFNACSDYVDPVPTTPPSKLQWERRSDDNMVTRPRTAKPPLALDGLDHTKARLGRRALFIWQLEVPYPELNWLNRSIRSPACRGLFASRA